MRDYFVLERRRDATRTPHFSHSRQIIPIIRFSFTVIFRFFPFPSQFEYLVHYLPCHFDEHTAVKSLFLFLNETYTPCPEKRCHYILPLTLPMVDELQNFQFLSGHGVCVKSGFRRIMVLIITRIQSIRDSPNKKKLNGT